MARRRTGRKSMAFYRPAPLQGPHAARKTWLGPAPDMTEIRFPRLSARDFRRFHDKHASGRERAVVIMLRQPTDRVVVNRPSPSETEGRVLPFRPRGALFSRPVPRPPTVPDLEKYER